MSQHGSPDGIGGDTQRGGAMKSSLQTGTDTMADPSGVSMSTDIGGSGICVYQRG